MADEQIQPAQSLIDRISPSAVAVTSKSMQINDVHTRTLFVSTYPRVVNMGWFSGIIDMEYPLDISIFVHPKDTGVVLKNLRSQLTKLEAQMLEEQSAGKVRNPLLETAIQDIEATRDRLQQGTESFFDFGVYITIYASTPEKLSDIENTIRGLLESRLVFAKRATFRMDEGFLSTIPLGHDRLQMHTQANTAPVSSLFPFVSQDLTSNQGILYGINLQNKSLVLLDRFNYENANTVVLGKSGGGKSYAVKLEILREMIYDTQIFVIDPENEYQHLTESLGGSVVDISISSPQHINPFDLPVALSDETTEDVLRNHIVDLLGFFKVLLGEISSEEESLLDEALRQTYALKDIGPETDLSTIESPLMSDFQSILEGMERTDSLVARLKRYTEGSFSGFLNNPTNINLNAQLIVFSIRDVNDEFRPVAMYLVLNHIWARVRHELRRRLLIIDEAWWIMKRKFGGEFLLSIAKRARKYYLGLTTITQDISDFLGSEFGGPVVNNSSLQLLLKQSPTSIDAVQEAFKLTQPEKAALLQASEGRGILFAGTEHIALRILASLQEHSLITSDPRELLELEAAKRELES